MTGPAVGRTQISKGIALIQCPPHQRMLAPKLRPVASAGKHKGPKGKGKGSFLDQKLDALHKALLPVHAGLTGTGLWQSSRGLLQAYLTDNDFEGCFCCYMVVIHNREGTLFYGLRLVGQV